MSVAELIGLERLTVISCLTWYVRYLFYLTICYTLHSVEPNSCTSC